MAKNAADSRRDIADFLLDVAAYSEIDADGNPEPVLHTMQRPCASSAPASAAIVQHYRFYHSEIDSGQWALKAFRQDPFDGELLKEYGIRTTTGAATGALIGLGVDMVTLGGSPGWAPPSAACSATCCPICKTINDKLAGKHTLHIDPETLTLLAARALDLLAALQTRGHAAQADIQMHSGKAPWPAAKLPAELNKARSQPKWCPQHPRARAKPPRSRRSRRRAGGVWAEPAGLILAKTPRQKQGGNECPANSARLICTAAL